VGGGGEVKGNGQAGAMLTMSTPTNGLKSWLAASSDHQIPYVHQLRAYAIGMRVRMSPNGNFLPEDKLRSQMYIRWAADTVATGHHSLTATLSGAPEYQPGDLMVGGGAYVSTWGGAGQLLVSSLPIGVTGWAAESKDHGIVASAQLGIGLIGMRRCPAGTTRCFNMKVQIDPPAYQQVPSLRNGNTMHR